MEPEAQEGFYPDYLPGEEPAFCSVCDGGHDGGEFGELCPATGRYWFEPSDPRDIGGDFDDGARDGNDPTVWW